MYLHKLLACGKMGLRKWKGRTITITRREYAFYTLLRAHTIRSNRVCSNFTVFYFLVGELRARAPMLFLVDSNRKQTR